MKTAPFLLEIGCEEIPAGMLPAAARELKAILEKLLSDERLLEGAEVETFSAPRRLTAVCKALRTRQQDAVREILGPPRAVAFDAVGRPTRAAESFAARQGIPVQSLYIVAAPRGECVAARQIMAGKAGAQVLSEVLPKAIAAIPWPKTMYWTGASGFRFIRPIRWLVAVLGRQVVRFEIEAVQSGKWTSGHRFLGKARVAVSGPEDYLEKLRRNFVLARPEERQEKLAAEMERLAAEHKLKVHEDAALLEQVVYLNEYPTAILGGFSSAYLQLPEEVLVTVMRGHQKYFALRGASGELAPNFLAVINLNADAKGLIRAGHERVLRARFADAEFFWHADQKCRLADNLEKLKAVTFQAQLGSYWEKVQRVRALAAWLAENWAARGLQGTSPQAADRAAALCKCDLVTGMVGEFSELQGIMGGLYAKAQGESEDIWQAVYDHYLPAGQDDALPRNLTGLTLAMADKLDTLAGCFAAGLEPTGSSDPFALRRAALGVVRIILEGQLPVSLGESVRRALKILAESKPALAAVAAEKAVLDFLVERARFIFQQKQGFAFDEISAALAAGADDLVDAGERIRALREIRRSENFEPLAVSFKRIRKILEKAGPESEWRLASVQPAAFEQEQERALHQAARQARAEAEEYKKQKRYREALERISELRPAVDRFFDQVMVMAEQEAVRRNRLTLLRELLGEFSTIADFSELVPAEK